MYFMLAIWSYNNCCKFNLPLQGAVAIKRPRVLIISDTFRTYCCCNTFNGTKKVKFLEALRNAFAFAIGKKEEEQTFVHLYFNVFRLVSSKNTCIFHVFRPLRKLMISYSNEGTSLNGFDPVCFHNLTHIGRSRFFVIAYVNGQNKITAFLMRV